MSSVDVHVALENLKELAEDGLSTKRVRRPWLSFIVCSMLAVSFFAAWGPITSALTASQPVVVAAEPQPIVTIRRRASPTSTPAVIAVRELASPPPPTPMPLPVAALAALAPAAAAGDVVVRLEFKFTSTTGSDAVAAVRLKLLPEYSRPSVDFVRFAADNSCDGELYRSENNFLVQGRIACSRLRGGRSSVPKVVKGACPAGVTPARLRQCPSHDPNCGCHGPIMSKGMVGWAGGSAGPDFFIYTAHMTSCAVGGCPATHWSHDHTVFATVADDQSWKTIETLYSLPVKRGGMTFFEKKVQVTVKPDSA